MEIDSFAIRRKAINKLQGEGHVGALLLLIQYARGDGRFKQRYGRLRAWAGFLVEVDDDVANVRRGAEELCGDICAAVLNDLINVTEDARHVPMDIEDTVIAFGDRHVQSREINSAGGAPKVDKINESGCHFAPNIDLGFRGGPADVWREDNIFQATQR
jgi:hypothetical protein